MAEVFLARQRGEEGFERLVAIKRILPQVAEDDDFVRMFVDEAKIAVQLSHPNIAQIYDLGREGDTFFIAQEYVHGRDMGAVVDRQAQAATPLPIPFVLYVATKVCEALAHAHEAHGAGGRPLNLIHRDVSPSNVLVSFEGGVKVIDFGLAKAAGRLVTTQAGVVKGKLAYLSSEQARGLEIDSRSDLFSLGVCMFEWLTGQRLFARRNDIETVMAVQKAAVPPLRAIRGDVPPVLQQIVLHALAPDPDRRFQSAQEMHDALLSFAYDTRLTMKRKAVGEYVRALFPDAVLDEPVPMDDDVPRDTRPARAIEEARRQPTSTFDGSFDHAPVFDPAPALGEAPVFDDETYAIDDAMALLESEAPMPLDADDVLDDEDDFGDPIESLDDSLEGELEDEEVADDELEPASEEEPLAHSASHPFGALASVEDPFESESTFAFDGARVAELLGEAARAEEPGLSVPHAVAPETFESESTFAIDSFVTPEVVMVPPADATPPAEPTPPATRTPARSGPRMIEYFEDTTSAGAESAPSAGSATDGVARAGSAADGFTKSPGSAAGFTKSAESADDGAGRSATTDGAASARREPRSPSREPPRPVRFEDTTFPDRDEGLGFDDTTAPFAGAGLDSLLAQAVATSVAIRTPEVPRDLDELDADTSAGSAAYVDPTITATGESATPVETTPAATPFTLETTPGAQPYELDFDDETRVGDAPFEDETAPGSRRR
jgi:serine/threonine protein kinase